MSTPSITVLMPVYNGEKYLREAIDSILCQTFTDFEFLIINDGSNDKTEEIILSYNDTRIRYIKNKINLKLIATLNKGIALAIGKYIARMDADDLSLPTRLERQFEFMERNKDVALCGTWYQLLGGANNVVRYVCTHNEIRMKMLYQSHFCHPTVIFRKSMIDTLTLKFDPLFIHAEDYDFFVRIAEKFSVANISDVLLTYRVHEQSVSLQNKTIQNNNSTLIKKRSFKNIGIDIAENELELYRSIEQHEYVPTNEYLKTTQILLEKIVAANDETAYFEKNFFNQLFGEFMFNISENHKTARRKFFHIHQASFLSSLKQLSSVQLLKFRVKEILTF